jgi:hypothetical protein
MPKAIIEGEITEDQPFSTLGRGDFFYLQFASILMIKVEAVSNEPIPEKSAEPYSTQYCGLDIRDGSCVRIPETSACRIPHAVKITVD